MNTRLWDCIGSSELRTCFTNGGIAYCMYYATMTPEQRKAAAAVIANANSNMNHDAATTMANLKSVGAFIEGGKIVHYNSERLRSAKKIQDFWHSIPKLHKPEKHNVGYMLFVRTFASNIHSKSEICAWMSRKSIEYDALAGVLSIFSAGHSLKKLIKFKKNLIDRKIRFRMPSEKWNICKDNIALWHYMRSINANITSVHCAVLPMQIVVPANNTPEILTPATQSTHVGKAPKRKSPPRVSPYNQESMLVCYKKQLLAMASAPPKQDHEWDESLLSSPRPCRCHEDPCWCLDPREIKRRTFD